MPWGWIFAWIIGDGRSNKVAKRIVVRWHLTFLRQVKFASLCICMSPIHLNGKIVENFKRLLHLKPLSQFYSNFIWSHLRVGTQKNAKMVAVRWPGWLPCQYMVKTFKNLLLQNRECLGAETLHETLGTEGLPKLLKELSYVDIWPFSGKVKFASLCICMSPITFVWENCWEFQTTSSEATEPNLLKFLAHLSTKCSWWAIVVSQCPSSVVRCPSSVVPRAASTIAKA